MIYTYCGFLVFVLCVGDHVGVVAGKDSTELDSKRGGCDKCGVANRFGTRVVGGERASIDKHPWMVGLKINGYLSCGAVLISGCYVLTAGHCVKRLKRVKDIKAVMGSENRYDYSSLTRDVVEISKHPNYRPNTTHDDIALLKIYPPVQFTDKIQPICLPDEGEDYVNRTASVIGFGYTTEGGNPSNNLREVSLTVIDWKKCHKIFEKDGEIYKNNLCAGGQLGKDACLGDSGGPLIRQRDDDSSFQVIGVVSWGVGCARDGIPGVYTQVNRYLPWINSVINGTGCCYPTADDLEKNTKKSFFSWVRG